MTHRKAPGLWLAALVLWVQLLLPALMCPGDMAQPSDTHGMCMAGSQAPAHRNDLPLHKGQCPACLSLHILHSGFVPPQAPAIPVASVRAAERQFVLPALFLPRYPRALPPSRGPPAPI